MKILVTGGAGYIGSHTCVELLNEGCEVVVVDNLSNSSAESLRRVEKITGKSVSFYEFDLIDKQRLCAVFAEHSFDAVIHFAGYKAVGESVQKPVEYYQNNIGITLVLLEVMREFGVKNLVFSSSATVYGTPKCVPIKEDFPLSTTNPYGSTKLFIEQILKDVYRADNTMNIAILRYFNPVGAHESGLIGEDPRGIPNNLSPYILKVAMGQLPKVNVFGNDYPTPDGTGVRDYIHVVDLAQGHVAALKKLLTASGLFAVNLGTGKGYSVLEMIKAFSEASGNEIPYEIAPRRAGDIAECYADTSYAREFLGFTAQKTLLDMCRDSWKWQKNNPNGYEK